MDSINPPPRVDSRSTGAGHAIIAGFGLCGRFIAELLDSRAIRYTVVDINPTTAQRCKSVPVIMGDIRDEAILRQAGIDRATLLALTMPGDELVLQAIQHAHRLRPDLCIIARVNYTSAGMQAVKLGARTAIVGEQLVAKEFHRVVEGLLSPVSARDDRPGDI